VIWVEAGKVIPPEPPSTCVMRARSAEHFWGAKSHEKRRVHGVLKYFFIILP